MLVMGRVSIACWWFSRDFWATILMEVGEFKSLAHFFRASFSLFSFCYQEKEGDPGIQIDQESETT